MRRIIIVEEDDIGRELKRITLPYTPSWEAPYTCPICGKPVWSMEVHQCNQPHCESTYA